MVPLRYRARCKAAFIWGWRGEPTNWLRCWTAYEISGRVILRYNRRPINLLYYSGWGSKSPLSVDNLRFVGRGNVLDLHADKPRSCRISRIYFLRCKVVPLKGLLVSCMPGWSDPNIENGSPAESGVFVFLVSITIEEKRWDFKKLRA